jgi:hypothetical protein
MKSLICESLWDTDVIVSDAKLEVHGAAVYHATVLWRETRMSAMPRGRKYKEIHIYREFANFAIVVAYVVIMVCSFMF